MPQNCIYTEVLQSLLDANQIQRDMSIIVSCGDKTDADVLRELKFENVVICNVDSRINGADFSPFSWDLQDAENLQYQDKTFDFGIVYRGLHHCYSPHKALLELVRVTKTGLVLFEPHDNLISRMGIFLGFGQDFEHASVFYNGCKFGGVKNGPIPNYIYRWTEAEIKKIISAMNAWGKSQFIFTYKMIIPWTQLNGRKKWWVSYLAKLVSPILKGVTFFFPRQSNNFAAVILHPRMPEDLYPWLKVNEGEVEVDPVWLGKQYK